MQAHLRRWYPSAVCLLIPSVILLPILFKGEMIFGSDMLNVFNYTRLFVAESFRSGRLPLWDPHTMAGFPQLAALQPAVFYPPTWICVFLSPGTFWTVTVWMHLVLTGIFTQRWLERGVRVSERASIVGAAVAMLSGYLWTHIFSGHQNYLWAYPWLIAVLWRFERFLAGPGPKRGVLLGGSLTLLFLAGVPQYVLFAGLLIAARSILAWRRNRDCLRDLGRAAGWLALGLLLGAPQLLPTLEMVGEMQRGGADDPRFFLDRSMEVRELPQLIFGMTVSESASGVSGATVLLVIAAFFGRRDQTLLWAGVALFGVLMALGENTPFHAIVTTLLPGSGQFRIPARYIVLFAVGAVALAALGFDALWNRDTRIWRGVAVVLGIAAAIQLASINSGFFQYSFDERYYRWPSVWSAHLQAVCGREYRAASAGKGSLIVDVGRCREAGVDHVGGYDPMMLRRYAELINALRGAPLGQNMPLLAAEAPHPAMDMLGAKVWHFKEAQPDASWPRWGKTDFYENPGALPRAWLVNNAVVLESVEERLRIMAKGPWDPRKTVILDSYPTEAPPVPTEKAAGRATVKARGPGWYEIEASNDADAYLVLSEAYYPGWTATVDGKKEDVLPANHLLQTVRLTAGKHVVRFEYHSRFLGLGFVVAALAALVPVGLFLVRRHRGQLALQRLPGAP